MSVRTLREVERSNHPVPATTITAIATELSVSPEQIILIVPDSHEDQKRGEFSPQIMLRDVDADGLAELLRRAQKIDWHLDHLRLVDEKVCRLVEQLGQAVGEFNRHLNVQDEDWFDAEEYDPFSLGAQLNHVKKRQAVASLMEQLARHQIFVLGAEYLQWRVSENVLFADVIHPGDKSYRSTRILALSVEQSDTRSRVVTIYPGSEPPKFAPLTNPPTKVFVDGMPLEEFQAGKVLHGKESDKCD